MDIENDKEFAVGSMTWSREDFVKLCEDYPDMQHLAQKGKEELPQFENLQVDGYHFFYKEYPHIKGEDDLEPGVAPHSSILKHMEGLEELKILKSQTIRNKMLSMVASERLNDIITNIPDEIKKAIKDHKEKQDALLQIEEELSQCEGEPPDDLIEKAERARQLAQQAGEEVETQLSDRGDAIRMAARSGLEKALEDTEDVREAISAFGCGSGGPNISSIPLKDQVTIAKMLKTDKELRTIATIAGRISRIADRAQNERPIPGADDITDITTGDRFDLLPASEMINLVDPQMEEDFYRRIVEHQVLNWETISLEKEGLGPIVYLLDGSGSMGEDRVGGLPILWGKGIGIRLYKECAKRKQPLYYIQFGSEGVYKEKRFEAAEGEELALMAFSKIFLDSGTHYPTALERGIAGLELIGVPKSDIVFVSDAGYPVDTISDKTTAFKQALQKYEANCYGIYIGTSPQHGAATFGEICSRTWGIDPTALADGKDVDCVKELFQELAPQKVKETR